MKSLALSFLLLIAGSISAQESKNTVLRNQIEEVVTSLVSAWSEGDAESFASNFTEDADFTVWFGMQLSGQKEIAFGHNIIFNAFYKNTTWDLKIDNVRFIDNNIALVHCSGAVLKKGDESPLEPDAVPLLVFQKINGDWKIVTLHNTPFAVNEFRANGDIRRMKKIMKDYKD